MNVQTVPAKIFHHAIVQMGHEDRYTRHKTQTNYIPIACDEEGYRLRNEDDSKHEVLLSHDEIYKELNSGEASVEYGWNNVQMQRLRILFGDKPFEKFPVIHQQRALFREKLIKKFDDEVCAELGKPPRWSEAKMLAWLKGARVAILSDAIDAQENGRADQVGTIVAFPTPSVKTFQRDYKNYHAADENILALVHRHHGPGQRFFKANPEAIAFAVKQARGYLSRLRPKYSHVYTNYRAALHALNESRDTPLPAVSRKKFVAIIGTFDEFEKVASRHGMKHAIRKFMKIKRKFDIQRPGQRIEIDHMKFDIITLLSEIGALEILPQWAIDKLKEADSLHQRIHVCAAIDVSTRYLLALTATTNPKAASAVSTLRQIMSDKRWLSTYVGARTPWIGRIWPTEVYTDNGTEFTAGRTEAVFRAARVNYTRPGAGDPQRRPFIESLFHSIGPLLMSYLDGKTFGSIMEKGDYDPTAHVSIDVDELIKVFLFAILDVYHNRPHAGLGGNTPHNAWVQATQEYEIKFPPNAAGMARIFGVEATRKIQTDGVVNWGITYNSDELQTHRRQTGQEIQIMYDPESAEFVLANGPQGWFPVKNTIGLDGTVTLHEWAAARKAIKARNASLAAQGMTVMYEAINRIRQIGEAATLRAGLSHIVPSDEDFEKMNEQVFGTWVATPVTIEPVLDDELVLREDPLRGGDVAAVAGGDGSDSAVVAALFEAFGNEKAPKAKKTPKASSFTEDGTEWK